MKKIICFVISLIMIFVFTINQIKAKNRNEFDEYVKKEAYKELLNWDIDISNTRIGSGIEIVNLKSEAKYYPVYENNIIKYVFEVYKVNGNLGHAFSSNAVDAIAQMITLGKGNFTVFAVLDHLYGYIENCIIDFNDFSYINPQDFHFNIPDILEYKNETIEFDIPKEFFDNGKNYTNTKSTWQTYYYNPGLGYGCVPQTLYNIYRNYGKSINNWIIVRGWLNNANGTSSTNNVFTHPMIQTYLSAYNVSALYQATSGSMNKTTVNTIINSNQKYIMAISSYKDYNSLGQLVVINYHATAVIDVLSSTTYRMCDPHGSSSWGYVTLTFNTDQFYSSGNLYTWDSGYYSFLTY